MSFGTERKGIAVTAVLALVLCAAMPMLVYDDSDAAAGDGTIYLRPGDTYTWSPELNIDINRIALSVFAGSTASATPTYSSTSTYGGVTAAVDGKDIKISVGSNASPGIVYVKVKAQTTSGMPQNAVASITVNVINPTVSYPVINTYQGGTVSQNASVSNTVAGKDITYTATGLPTGLTINASNGTISGTVASNAEAKSYGVTVRGTVATVPSQTFSTTVTINVAGSMSIADPGVQFTKAGTAKNITLSGTNIPADATWSIVSGGATGISVSSTAGSTSTLGFTNAVAAGTYNVKVKAVNPTSGQSVERTVTVKVGSVSITEIGATNGVGGEVSNGAVTIYAKNGTAATFSVVSASVPSDLGLTLSAGGNDAGKVNVSGQNVSTAASLAAGTYTFTLTETQASTGATATVTVTLVVDPVLDFTNAATSGSLSVKGAGN